MTRDFLTVLDLSAGELQEVLDLAAESKGSGTAPRLLDDGIYGLLFEKPSTRTRVSFEVAIRMLGGETIFLSGKDLQLHRGETPEETGKVLSRYLDGLVVRTFAHQSLSALAAAASIPVINALTDLHHPCQALGDLLTMREALGDLTGLPVAYVGDGNNNVAHSLIEAASLTGLDLRVACPPGYRPDPGIVKGASRATPRVTVRILEDPRAALDGVAVVYTDVWTSMGQEGEEERRRRVLSPYRVDAELLTAAPAGVKVMHCLPAHRGEEITSEVLDSAASLVWDQAENRLWAQIGLLRLLYKGEWR